MIIEKQFEYKGYECVVAMTALAFRNGYVKIPKGHRCLNKGFNMDNIDCHGGVTFFGKREAFCDDDSKWIGFDTAHCFDGKDYDKALELFSSFEHVIESLKYTKQIDDEYGLNKYEPKSLEYCVDECKKIVDQLIEME